MCNHQPGWTMSRRHLLRTAAAVRLGPAAHIAATEAAAPPGTVTPTPLPRKRPLPTVSQANCARTSVGLTPLPDLGRGTYRGYQGGLYPDGLNQPPTSYAQAGLALARQVVPRDADGQPNAGGRIVLLSIGMSNATAEFSVFKTLADADQRKNPLVTVVDGAQNGQDAEAIKQADAPYWQSVAQQLQGGGVAAAQVQAVWLKEAIIEPTEPFPTDAQLLQADLRDIIAILAHRFPHLQLIYLSSRTYAGYASSPLNPEPYAYESGFAVKWLIAQHIQQGGSRPWVGWGPYLWTDGTTGRRDGLVWTCADVLADGTHPSASGCRKVANLLLTFFATDATAAWFRRQ
jgi:hypothetical protein